MNLKKQLLVSMAFCFAILGANAQTEVEVVQGLKLPRLTTAERDQIQKQGDPSNPYAKGQTIFNTDNHCLEYWNGNKWISLCDGNESGGEPCVPPAVSITSVATATCMGTNLNMTATPADGSWSSDTPATATIDPASGVLTPVAAGTTVITYSYTDGNGCTNTDVKAITVNVNPSVSITGASTINIGSTTALSPTSGGTWASNNTGVATVTNAGTVTGVAVGSATFTFTSSTTGCKATTNAVTVNCPTPALPSTITGSVVVCSDDVAGLTYSVTNVSGITYTWTLPAGWTKTAGGTTNSITVTAGTAGGTISVTPSNSCGKNGTARTLAVTVINKTDTPPSACAVRSTLTAAPYNGWIKFMCYNLGANQTMTPAQQAAYVSTGNADATVYGDAYQWGRLTDGHEKRTSNTTTTLSTTDTPGHDDFILVSSPPTNGDWRSPQNNYLWQPSTKINNPCPAGWRVPTNAEISSIIPTTGNLTLSKLNGQLLNTGNYWKWNDSGTGGWLVSPDCGSTYTLFLPAAGYRYGKTGGSVTAGNFTAVGRNIRYWTTGTSTNDAYFLYINDSGAVSNGPDSRANGQSVRCVADE